MCVVELTRMYVFGLFYHLMTVNPTVFFFGMLKRVCIKLPSLPLLFISLKKFYFRYLLNDR